MLDSKLSNSIFKDKLPETFLKSARIVSKIKQKGEYMESKNRNIGPLVGGTVLIVMGLLALGSQVFPQVNFWGAFWPLIIVSAGALFFVGMFAGGKSAAGLAIPGSIVSTIGLMLLVQNLTNHWESWAYGWTVILIGIGLGIYIAGRWSENTEQRANGIRVARVGLTLFVIFGAFFELIFNASRLGPYFFPAALIALGLYLTLVRSGLLKRKSSEPMLDESIKL